MRFEQAIEIAAARARVWDVLLDPARVARCIPGVQDVSALADGRYTARVVERVGPFRVAVDVEIALDETSPPSFLRALVTGRDRLLGSAVKQTVELRLEDALADATRLSMATDVSVLGKLGSLGYGVVRAKAADVMASFAANLKRELEGTEARGNGVV
jgi:carbon monoxide dehydrogenase subunit G